MKTEQFLKKIKNYSIVSFLLPLIAINLCLFIYQLLGNNEHYRQFDWGIKSEYSIQEYLLVKSKDYSLLGCPEKKYDPLKVYTYHTTDNKTLSITELKFLIKKNSLEKNINSFKKLKINKVEIKLSDEVNDSCIKNHRFSYFFLNTFKPLDKFFTNIKINNANFGKVKNPYIYGDASISRTARNFPTTFIFKPLIILSAFFLFLYWKNNLNLLTNLKNQNTISNFSKKFFYFGLLSCIFLAFHAAFLGLDFESKLFDTVRKLIIISFIIFEIFAQILLVKNLYEIKQKIQIYINFFILKLKIAFVIIIFATTCIAFSILIFGDPSTAFKHILEWNYFAFLLFYYLLSRLLWKP